MACVRTWYGHGLPLAVLLILAYPHKIKMHSLHVKQFHTKVRLVFNNLAVPVLSILLDILKRIIASKHLVIIKFYS